MKAEIIRNMPDSEYHAHPAASQSRYKAFRATTENKARHELEKQHEETPSKIVGTCLHALVLEGSTIYVRAIEGDERTKAVKEAREAQATENPGKYIVTAKQAQDIEGMAAGVMRNKAAVMILEASPDRELSIFINGEKCRIDIMSPCGPADLKSTGAAADARTWAKTMETWGYAIQAAHYLDMCALAGLPCDDFHFIASESFEPYDCAVYRISHEAIEIGRRELCELRAKYQRCIESGIYRGYPDEPITVDLPAWKMRKEYEV